MNVDPHAILAQARAARDAADYPTNMAKTDLLTPLGERIHGICDDAGQDGRFTRFRR